MRRVAIAVRELLGVSEAPADAFDFAFTCPRQYQGVRTWPGGKRSVYPDTFSRSELRGRAGHGSSCLRPDSISAMRAPSSLTPMIFFSSSRLVMDAIQRS